MDGFSTITQKGQVAIPKVIRDYFSLKPFDRVHFTIKDGKIVAQPVLGIKDMLGIIPGAKKLNKKEYKDVVKKQILKKHDDRS